MPISWRAISRSISVGVRPTAFTAPMNGTITWPSALIICSGGEVPRAVELEDVRRGSPPVMPNSAAGGASQIAISSTSPAPMTAPDRLARAQRIGELTRQWVALIRPRATSSVTSTTAIFELPSADESARPTARELGPPPGAMAQPAVSRQTIATPRCAKKVFRRGGLPKIITGKQRKIYLCPFLARGHILAPR